MDPGEPPRAYPEGSTRAHARDGVCGGEEMETERSTTRRIARGRREGWVGEKAGGSPAHSHLSPMLYGAREVRARSRGHQSPWFLCGGYGARQSVSVVRIRGRRKRPPCARVRCGEEDGVAAPVSLPGGSVKQPHARSAVARSVDWVTGGWVMAVSVGRQKKGLLGCAVDQWVNGPNGWIRPNCRDYSFSLFFSAFFFIPNSFEFKF